MSQGVVGAVSRLLERVLRAGLVLAVPPLRLVSLASGTAASLGEGILGRFANADDGLLPESPPDEPPRQWRPPTEPSASPPEASRDAPGADTAAAGPDEPPVPDWDELTVGRMRTRIRVLRLDELVVLREWEKQHSARLQVLTMLDNRIARTAAEEEALSS